MIGDSGKKARNVFSNTNARDGWVLTLQFDATLKQERHARPYVPKQVNHPDQHHSATHAARRYGLTAKAALPCSFTKSNVSTDL